jgi:hypothetical protein
MTKTTIIAALTLAVLTTEAMAQTDSGGTTAAQEQIHGYVSADTLHELCQQQPARAMYYVAGVLDALMLNASNAPVCTPAGSTLAQARDVVCNYLRDNPAKRHYNTASSVWSAQSQGWPCRK